eukprot:jgi/Chlat1/6984/Chrsp56S06676
MPNNFRLGCTKASQGMVQDTGSITALHFVTITLWPAQVSTAACILCQEPHGCLSIPVCIVLNHYSFLKQYQGALLMGDYSIRCIWLLPLTAGLPDPSKAFTLVDDIGVLDIKTDGVGTYAVEYGGDLPGEVYRILHASENYFDARISASTNSPNSTVVDNVVLGVAPLTVSFDSSTSFVSPNVSVVRAWDLKTDSSTSVQSTAVTASATYVTPGTFIATLAMTGPDGITRSDTSDIQVAGSTAELPMPVIKSPVVGTTWAVGQSLLVAGGGSHPETDTLSWDITILHCASPALNTCHSHDYQELSGVSSFTLVPPEHDFYPALVLKLTVTTVVGFAASTTLTLLPRQTAVTLTSGPVGAMVANIFYRTPPTGGLLTHQAVIGSTFYISASPTTAYAGVPYVFAGWSDGGLQNHEVIVPATPTQRITYTATYAINTPAPGSIGALPAGLSPAYVGSAPFAGFLTQGGAWWDSRTNILTVTGAGLGATGNSDSLYLVYKTVTQVGVVDVVASITSVAGDAKATAGVTIRAGGLDPHAFSAILVYSSTTQRLVFTVRSSLGGGTISTSTPSTLSLPVWVGLRYTARSVAARYSVDGGKTWTTWGNNVAPTPTPLGCDTGTCAAGVGVAAGEANIIAQAAFAGLTMT